jgi:hypothetical protein
MFCPIQAGGRYASTTSASVRPSICAAAWARSIRLWCVRTTPLAAPVVPEVKNIAAVSEPAPFPDFRFQERRILAPRLGAKIEQPVATHELGLLVVAQAARLVVVDVSEAGTLRQDLEQLVDLLLILGQRVRDRRVSGSGTPFPAATASWYSGTGMPPRHCAAHIAA